MFDITQVTTAATTALIYTAGTATTVIVLFKMFSLPITHLIGRTNDVGIGPFKAKMIEPQSQETSSPPAVATIPSAPTLPATDLIPKFFLDVGRKQSLQAIGINDPTERELKLADHCASFFFIASFEKIYSKIFGSQLSFLTAANSQPLPEQIVRNNFYNLAVEQNKEAYKHTSFEAWTSFLTSFQLVNKTADSWIITDLGRAFLAYLMRVGHSLIKPF
jgi:hypothetical protein